MIKTHIKTTTKQLYVTDSFHPPGTCKGTVTGEVNRYKKHEHNGSELQMNDHPPRNKDCKRNSNIPHPNTNRPTQAHTYSYVNLQVVPQLTPYTTSSSTDTALTILFGLYQVDRLTMLAVCSSCNYRAQCSDHSVSTVHAFKQCTTAFLKDKAQTMGS